MKKKPNNNLLAFSDFLHIGQSDELPPYVQNKITTTNLALILTVFGTFCYMLSIYFLVGFNVILFPPAIALFSSCFMLLSHRLGAILYSRPIVCLIPLITNTIYIGLLTPKDSQISASFISASLAYLLFIFVIIDFKETKLFYTVLLLEILILGATNIIKNNISLDNIALYENLKPLDNIQALTNFALVYILLNSIYKSHENENIIIKKNITNLKQDLSNKRKHLKENYTIINDLDISNEKEQMHNDNLEAVEKLNTIVSKSQPFEKSINEILNEVSSKLALSNIIFYQIIEDGKEKKAVSKASFGFGYKKYISRTFTMNEGLVGEVLFNKKPLTINTLPDHFSDHTSGMKGDKKDQYLRIEPLIYENNLSCILEISRLTPLAEKDLDYLSKASKTISEYLGYSIRIAKKELMLQDTLKENEQLQMEEEELSQNLEEILSMQEGIAKKEAYYVNKINNLELNISQLKKKLRLRPKHNSSL